MHLLHKDGDFAAFERVLSEGLAGRAEALKAGFMKAVFFDGENKHNLSCVNMI